MTLPVRHFSRARDGDQWAGPVNYLAARCGHDAVYAEQTIQTISPKRDALTESAPVLDQDRQLDQGLALRSEERWRRGCSRSKGSLRS
jgi:hypothetical protein